MTTKSAKRRDYLSWAILGVFFLPCVGGLAAMEIGPDLRVRLFYVEGRCVVIDKRLVEERSGKGINSTYRPEFFIRYTVDGQEYTAFAYKAAQTSSGLRGPEERAVERFTVGEEYPCWYDPDDPSKVVLVRGWSWFTFVVLTVFAVALVVTVRNFVMHRRSTRPANG